MVVNKGTFDREYPSLGGLFYRGTVNKGLSTMNFLEGADEC